MDIKQRELSLNKKRIKVKEELQIKKEKLFEEWKKLWEMEIGNNKLDTFFSLFSSVYWYVWYSKEINKYKNFRMKRVFLFIPIVGVLMCFTCFVRNILCEGNSQLSDLMENSLLIISLILLIFFGIIISKWLDIKKYQETWARHSWHLHMMEVEMLRFIDHFEPYNNVDSRITFAERIIKIWDMNEEKFVHNMEDKEKGLMDIYSELQKLKIL